MTGFELQTCGIWSDRSTNWATTSTLTQICLIKNLINFIFLNGPFPASFSLFSSFQYSVDSIQMFDINKFLPMTGFEPRASGIRSDRSTNWATTTSINFIFLLTWFQIKLSALKCRFRKDKANFLFKSRTVRLFFKYGPNPASFCLFSSFSQYNVPNRIID